MDGKSEEGEVYEISKAFSEAKEIYEKRAIEFTLAAERIGKKIFYEL